MEKFIKHKWLILVLVTGIGFFVDWFTKYLADTRLTYGIPVPVVGDYLQWLLVYNKGALFGLNPQSWMPWFPVNQFFLVFSVLAIVVLLLYYRSLKSNEVLLHWGMIFILPGALGNMFDRVVHAHKGVIDFVRIGVSETLYWPIFNMADVYVTVGVGLILLGSFLDESKKQKVADEQRKTSAENAERINAGSTKN